jgi:hypothetical protein
MKVTQSLHQAAVMRMKSFAILEVASLNCIYFSHYLSNYSKMEIASGSKLPANIGDLTALEVLNLSETNLGGIIPSSICLLSKLRELIVYTSKVEGAMPACLEDNILLYVITKFNPIGKSLMLRILTWMELC